MPANNQVKLRVWIVGLSFATLASGGWILWNRYVIPPPVSDAFQARIQPAVRLAKTGLGRGDEVLRERAEYFDPTPLFFPTEWNYGHGTLRERVRRQPGQIFGDVDPKFVEFKPKDTAPPVVRLSDVVVSGNEAPFAGMGEIEVKPAPLRERSGFIEVKRLADSETVIDQSLMGLVLPHEDFAPLEFLVVVGKGGMVAEPILTAGSGWEDDDSFLRTYLAKSFRLGERVSPGIYRILIGP